MRQLNFQIYKLIKIYKIKIFKKGSNDILEKYALLMKIKLKDLANQKINKNIYKEFSVKKILYDNFIIA